MYAHGITKVILHGMLVILSYLSYTQTKREKKITNRVPYLQFDWFIVNGDHSSPKFNTDGQIMHGLKPLVRKL